jgi:hypothetical protein
MEQRKYNMKILFDLNFKGNRGNFTITHVHLFQIPTHKEQDHCLWWHTSILIILVLWLNLYLTTFIRISMCFLLLWTIHLFVCVFSSFILHMHFYHIHVVFLFLWFWNNVSQTNSKSLVRVILLVTLNNVEKLKSQWLITQRLWMSWYDFPKAKVCFGKYYL